MVNRLERDTLIERLARPRGPFTRVEVHESTGSTNDDAEARPEPYLLVVAAEQTAGRGRRARAWASPPGTSVSMSLVLPLTAVPGGAPPDPGWIPLVVGLGVRDALLDLIGPHGARVTLKWPNDVLVEGARATSAAPTVHVSAGGEGGRAAGGAGGGDAGGAGGAAAAGDGAPAKIAGILCQLLPGVDSVIAGIGINVTVPMEALPVPQGTAAPATSLHLCGAERPISREAVVEAVSLAVERRHAAWLAGGERAAALQREYRQLCVTVGALVDVHLPGGEIRRATATGIADGGELEIVDDRGFASTVRAGDVIHIRPRAGA